MKFINEFIYEIIYIFGVVFKIHVHLRRVEHVNLYQPHLSAQQPHVGVAAMLDSAALNVHRRDNV